NQEIQSKSQKVIALPMQQESIPNVMKDTERIDFLWEDSTRSIQPEPDQRDPNFKRNLIEMIRHNALADRCVYAITVTILPWGRIKTSVNELDRESNDPKHHAEHMNEDEQRRKVIQGVYEALVETECMYQVIEPRELYYKSHDRSLPM